MVVDNEVFKRLGSDFNKTYEFCKDIAKHVNAFYLPLNIFVALIDVEIWSKRNRAKIYR